MTVDARIALFHSAAESWCGCGCHLPARLDVRAGDQLTRGAPGPPFAAVSRNEPYVVPIDC